MLQSKENNNHYGKREKDVCHHYSPAVSLYAPFQQYQPKIVNPMAIGVKTAMMITQGTGLEMSPFASLLILRKAATSNAMMVAGPDNIHTIPRYRFKDSI